jgi:hypothetical protein
MSKYKHKLSAGITGMWEKQKNAIRTFLFMPTLVAARSKAWVCGCSNAEIAGSNSARGMDVCLLRELCVVRLRSLRRDDLSMRSPTVRVCVCNSV